MRLPVLLILYLMGGYFAIYMPMVLLFFLLIVYIHIGRGLYYGSFVAPRAWIWITGMIIFLLMMGTAFIGYVLPWGQMSLWGATVITNLLSALPYGDYLAMWIWGGFAVGAATLNRFF